MKSDHLYSILLIVVVLFVFGLLVLKAKQDIAKEKVQTCIRSAVDKTGVAHCAKYQYK